MYMAAGSIDIWKEFCFRSSKLESLHLADNFKTVVIIIITRNKNMNYLKHIFFSVPIYIA